MLQRDSEMTVGPLMRDTSLLLRHRTPAAMPFVLLQEPLHRQTEVSEGRTKGLGTLWSVFWWLCNAMSPGRDLGQCSGAFEYLPAPDTSPYFTTMHHIQAVQEIGCNRYVVMLRKNLTMWNHHSCLSCRMVRWETPHLLLQVNWTDCASKGDQGWDETLSLTSQRQVCWQELRKDCKTTKQSRNVATVILK